MRRSTTRARELWFAVPAVAATLALVWVLPDAPWLHLDQPAYLGALGYLVVVGVVLAQRLRGRRGSRLERRCLAVFLAGMPVVYVASWSAAGGGPGWLGIELVGIAVFWPLAALGAVRSPWYLAGGIAGHAAWDLWHHGLTAYVPEWYTLGCLVVDLAVAIYVSGEIDAWRAQRTLR